MKLYHSQQVYQLDQLAITQDKQPGLQLMQKAAEAVWQAMQKSCPRFEHIVVVAGSGNNGGDAFALALLAKNDGLNVEIFSAGELSHQSAESAFYRKQWQQLGGEIRPWPEMIPQCDVIVDGLLGIGLSKSLDSKWQSMIRQINQHSARKVCIDIPSGLNANTGVGMPCAVEADLTVTFIARKAGCWLADGPDYCGRIVFDDLGISNSSKRQVEAVIKVLDERHIRLPAARKNNSHKNQYGHVLVIGGNRGMPGAVQLAGSAALRAGAGLVSLCVQPDNYSIAAGSVAELMVSEWNNLSLLLEQATVIVVGPGLGHDKQSEKVLHQLRQVDKPMVIDADAIRPDFISSLKTRSAVLTPHPGEAARLLNSSARTVQQDRTSALQELTQSWSYVSVLKGAGTLIAQAGAQVTLCSQGHAGMASAGMGDVLSGMIAAYIAQGLDPLQAAKCGVLAHALAAENYASNEDANSLIASDIIDRIGLVMRKLKQAQNEL